MHLSAHLSVPHAVAGPRGSGGGRGSRWRGGGHLAEEGDGLRQVGGIQVEAAVPAVVEGPERGGQDAGAHVVPVGERQKEAREQNVEEAPSAVDVVPEKAQEREGVNSQGLREHRPHLPPPPPSSSFFLVV